MSRIIWFLWWLFGRQVVKVEIGTEIYAAFLRRTPSGQPFTRWACGVKYMVDEPGPWPKINELAPAQPPAWRRMKAWASLNEGSA